MKKKIDGLGRVGIPKSIRTRLEWEKNTYLEIFVKDEDGEVVIKKAEERCVCCNSEEQLVPLKDGFYLCRRCAKEKFQC